MRSLGRYAPGCSSFLSEQGNIDYAQCISQLADLVAQSNTQVAKLQAEVEVLEQENATQSTKHNDFHEVRWCPLSGQVWDCSLRNGTEGGLWGRDMQERGRSDWGEGVGIVCDGKWIVVIARTRVEIQTCGVRSGDGGGDAEMEGGEERSRFAGWYCRFTAFDCVVWRRASVAQKADAFGGAVRCFRCSPSTGPRFGSLLTGLAGANWSALLASHCPLTVLFAADGLADACLRTGGENFAVKKSGEISPRRTFHSV